MELAIVWRDACHTEWHCDPLGFKKSSLKQSGTYWPEGEVISAGMICQRWHSVVMMEEYWSLVQDCCISQLPGT